MRTVAVTIAMLALTLAVRTGDGTGSPTALIWLALAIVALIFAMIAPARPLKGRGGMISGAALAILVLIHLLKPPTIMASLAPSYLPLLAVAVFITALFAAAARLLSPGHGTLILLLVLAGGAFAWTWTLFASRDVYNDVIAFHRAAAAVLRDGHNPYATSMPDVYGPDSSFYAAGMVRDGRVQYGYTYPPIALLLAAAGQALGDVRWMLIPAGVAAAALIALAARGSPRSTAAAAMFLIAAPAFFVVPLGYTDVYLAAALAAVVFCAARFSWATPIAIGVMFAVKQYAIILLPVVWLLIPSPWTASRLLRFFLPAAAVAALLTLPPLLFDASAYWRALVLFHLRQPFRADSLSFLPLLGESWRWLSFITLIISSALALRCCPRTPGGFALAAALVLTCFFAVSHHAFANYYFVAIAALCAALAADRADEPDRRPRPDRYAPAAESR